MKKTLVTGGAGFLGRSLVRFLVDGGADVRVLDINSPAELVGRAEMVRGSVLDADAVAGALCDVAQVYHLAGMVSRDPDDKPALLKLHVEGTRIVCREAARAGVERIVMSSTSGCIAVSEDGTQIPDETWPPPISIIHGWPYYLSKLYQEETARRETTGGPDLVMVNPSLLLGPGDATLAAYQDIFQFLGREIPVVPPGGISFVDVRDTVPALVAAMERGRAGDRYLVGGPNWPFATFFGRLERLTKVKAPRLSLASGLYVLAGKALDSVYRKLDRKPPVDRISMEMGRYFWYLDCTKAEQELGFAARDPGETLQDTIAYLGEHRNPWR